MKTTEPRIMATASHEVRIAALALAGFWLLHLGYRTMLVVIGAEANDLRDPALWTALLFGFMLSIALCATLKALIRRGLAFCLILTALLSLPISLIYASVEMTLFFQLSPTVTRTSITSTMSDGTVVTTTADGKVIYRQARKPAVTINLPPLRDRLLARAPQMIVANATGWYFFYFGLGAFFVGLTNAERLRRAERAAVDYQRLAQTSQLRALRYQVNPHFLFNTLNSLSALIMTRRADEAERMILALSSFFRTTLAIDPADDITLAEELALQRLYLSIEESRFPDRLRVVIDIDPAFETLLVPALILQPLVENAVKHGVSPSQAPITIHIRATLEDAEIIALEITNNVPLSARIVQHSESTGVGLANVRERLAARYGTNATCESGRMGEDLYCVALRMPAVWA